MCFLVFAISRFWYITCGIYIPASRQDQRKSSPLVWHHKWYTRNSIIKIHLTERGNVYEQI